MSGTRPPPDDPGEPRPDPDRRGAGRGGGLLMVAIVLFMSYLAFTALAGIFRLVATVLLLGAAAALIGNVLRRR